MDEFTNDLDNVSVKCPVCDGRGTVYGPATIIHWFECGYCEGTGEVSQGRFQYWYDRHFREHSDLFGAGKTESATKQD
jgi:DnaJ-class molecular chaperone